ncbi:hypothetical protein, partial [Helicobacter sp. 12S02634-8]|uniref:hypothetical protein n=1 Tax=Helicobacter sp. 12S02634-8 TaxID=1476199 RepID=UPI001554454E
DYSTLTISGTIRQIGISDASLTESSKVKDVHYSMVSIYPIVGVHWYQGKWQVAVLYRFGNFIKAQVERGSYKTSSYGGINAVYRF